MSGVAGRYAQALFDLAKESNSTDKVGADLKAFEGMIGESDDLRRFLRSPAIPADEQVKALDELCRRAGIAGTAVRRALAGRVGDAAFRGLFSVLSVVAISGLVIAFNRQRKIDPVSLWVAPAWLGPLLAALMAVAFVLFVASVTAPNPTAVGGEKLLAREPTGIARITRHPMLWAFAIWAFVHVVGNGDLVSLVFFGAFGLTALLGMPSIDRKLAARDASGFRELAERTSVLPFAAIAGGRNRLAVAEIGWIAPLGGLALLAILLWFHPSLFGVAPYPPG